MEFLPNNNYTVFGRCDTFNTSDGIINMSVTLKDDTVCNIKVTINHDDLEIGKVYLFNFDCNFNGTRNQLILKQYKDIFYCDLKEEVYEVLEKFYPYVSCGIQVLDEKLTHYLASLKNPVIREITLDIFNRYRHDFLIYPAAVRMHHNYIGGLAYHTLTICELAERIADVYDCVNYDYLIAGALLHDISKIIEFKGPIAAEYSIRGQLLGHLVMGAMEIDETAKRLNYDKTEEAMLLEHMLISHHGQPQFGACKKPMTPEALILWLLDTMDSKLRVIDEAFENVTPGSFSEVLGVLDRMRCYKSSEK